MSKWISSKKPWFGAIDGSETERVVKWVVAAGEDSRRKTATDSGLSLCEGKVRPLPRECLPGLTHCNMHRSFGECNLTSAAQSPNLLGRMSGGFCYCLRVAKLPISKQPTPDSGAPRAFYPPFPPFAQSVHQTTRSISCFICSSCSLPDNAYIETLHSVLLYSCFRNHQIG